jgi:hypothetical protein
LLLKLAWRRGKTTEFDRLVLGLGAWVAINALAIAYGRGAGAGRPAARYMDFLSLGFVANAMALLAMIDLAVSRAVVWRVGVGALAGWLVFATLGIERLTERMLIDLQGWRKYSAAHETVVRRFVLGDDVAMLASKRGPVAIPYPSGYTLAGMLRDPYLRRILPARVRPPLHVEPKVTATAGFVTGGRSVRGIPTDPLQRAWLSLTGEGRKSRGRFTSEHIVCQSGGRLRFQVSGYLGWEHNSLAIKNLRTGETAPISPATVAKEDWTEVLVTCPADLFEIVAIDDAPDSWFGFREPIEVARGSLAAEWLINRAGMLR